MPNASAAEYVPQYIPSFFSSVRKDSGAAAAAGMRHGETPTPKGAKHTF